MSQSYDKIDYQLRPAKAVERKMMAQLFSRLSVFEPIEKYRYIGMGSVYFSDFSLFHSSCGFEKMISIEDEQDPLLRRRFEFNVPVGCIDIHFARTTKVLPQLTWEQHTVAWLDYDGAIDKDVLADLAYMASMVRSGSLIAISINAERYAIRNKKQLVQKLEKMVGREKIPSKAFEAEAVERDTYVAVLHSLLTAELTRAVTLRNAGADSANKVIAKQLFFYTYEDGALMLTLGWLILNQVDFALLKYCRFASFKHAKSGSIPFDIVLPKLTPAEMRAINRCDISNKYETLSFLPLKREQIDTYRKLQPYWPMSSFSGLA